MGSGIQYGNTQLRKTTQTKPEGGDKCECWWRVDIVVCYYIDVKVLWFIFTSSSFWFLSSTRSPSIFTSVMIIKPSSNSIHSWFFFYVKLIFNALFIYTFCYNYYYLLLTWPWIFCVSLIVLLHHSSCLGGLRQNTEFFFGLTSLD